MESPSNMSYEYEVYMPMETEVLYPEIETPDLDAVVECDNDDDDEFDDEMLELMNTWGWNDHADEEDTGDYAGATQYLIDYDNGFDIADEF